MLKNLKEKEWVRMKILNKVNFHSSGSYYILEDPFYNKHLMEAEWYEKYPFEKGNTINCRVDKINCKGKIFFEPEHPLYKEGEVYNFDISIEGNSRSFIDGLGTSCVVEREENKKTTRGRVVKIKKGRCYIELI